MFTLDSPGAGGGDDGLRHRTNGPSMNSSRTFAQPKVPFNRLIDNGPMGGRPFGGTGINVKREPYSFHWRNQSPKSPFHSVAFPINFIIIIIVLSDGVENENESGQTMKKDKFQNNEFWAHYADSVNQSGEYLISHSTLPCAWIHRLHPGGGCWASSFTSLSFSKFVHVFRWQIRFFSFCSHLLNDKVRLQGNKSIQHTSSQQKDICIFTLSSFLRTRRSQETIRNWIVFTLNECFSIMYMSSHTSHIKFQNSIYSCEREDGERIHSKEEEAAGWRRRRQWKYVRDYSRHVINKYSLPRGMGLKFYKQRILSLSPAPIGSVKYHIN